MEIHSVLKCAALSLYDANDNNKVLYSYGIGMAFNATALLLGVLSVNDPYSDDKHWSFKVLPIKLSPCKFTYSVTSPTRT